MRAPTWIVALALQAAVLGSARPALAGAGWLRPDDGELRAEEVYVDNLFEEGPAHTKQSDAITALWANVDWDLRWKPRSRGVTTVAAEISGLLHRRIKDADEVTYGLQVRHDLGRLTPSVYYRGSPRRLLYIDERVDDGVLQRKNVFYREHIAGTELEMGFFRVRPLRVRIGYEAKHRDFRPAFSDRDVNLGHEPTLDARLRLFGAFQPRAGIDYAIQEARAPNRSRRGPRIAVGFDGGWNRLHWGFRWDQRRWRYDDALPDDSNFQRKDERTAYRVYGEVRLVGGLALNLRYRFLDGFSTREDRNFTKSEFGAGLVYDF